MNRPNDLNAEPKTKSIAKKVHEHDGRLTLPDWARMIESTCVLTLRRYRRGEPSHYLDRHTIVEPLTFAINPLVPKNKACILFSDGGKGKSTFALALCLAVNAGATVAGVSALKGKALYLDWEDDVDVHARRLQAIQAGHPELVNGGRGVSAMHGTTLEADLSAGETDSRKSDYVPRD